MEWVIQALKFKSFGSLLVCFAAIVEVLWFLVRVVGLEKKIPECMLAITWGIGAEF
jgi:hypothetical protein